MKWGESAWLISIHNTMSIGWSANQSDPRESQGSGLVLSACRSMWWAAQAKTSMFNPSTSTRKPRNWICPKLKISENINKAKYRERHKSGKRDSFKSTRKFDTKYRNVAQKAEQDMTKGHSKNSKGIFGLPVGTTHLFFVIEFPCFEYTFCFMKYAVECPL